MHSRLWLVGLVGLVVGSGGAWWVAASAQSPQQAAARASEPVGSLVTARVERRVLSATVIQRGDVRGEVSVSVGVPASVEGTAVVTQRPVAVGDVVAEGVRVLEVSGRPVFVLAGDVPIYRSLRPLMAGPDVAQLQVALTRLGYTPDVDGVFGEATKGAVVALYESAGYEPVPAFETAAAEIDLAERTVVDAEVAVADAQDAAAEVSAGVGESALTQAQIGVNQAERGLDAARGQRVSSVRLAEEQYNATIRARDRLLQDPTTPAEDLDAAGLQIGQAAEALEELRRSTADSVASAEEALELARLALDDAKVGQDVSRAERDLASATDALSRAERDRDAVTARNGPTVAQGEIVFIPQLPGRVQSVPLDSGTDAPGVDSATGNSLLELSAGRLVVDTTVRPNEQGLIRIGTSLELLDETTTASYAGRVTAIAGDAIVGADGQLGYPAVITPDTPLPDSMPGANLRVTITTASTDSATLVVPLAAVTSAANGTTRVSTVKSPDDMDPIDVPVRAGLSADGFVAIEPIDPNALAVDDLVVVG